MDDRLRSPSHHQITNSNKATTSSRKGKQMSTLRSWRGAIISLLTIGILAGCSEPNGPRGDGQVDELTTLASIQSDFESMKVGNLSLDNAKGVFSIGWRPAPGRAFQSAQRVGDAMAIGFEGTGQS